MVSTGGGFSTDFYIKDEGYAAIKVIATKAKEFCNLNGYDNSLLKFGHKFCGQSVWTPGMKEGMYQFGLKRSTLHIFVNFIKKHGFTVETELEPAF